MKKTAIVSCYFQHNYGSMLQAYATQMALDKLGYENETIDISGFNGEIKKAKLLYFAKASLTSDILLSKLGMAKNVLIKKFSKTQYAESSKVRAEKFDAFSHKQFRLSPKYNSKAELGNKCKDNYSSVLVGSDQLWLPGNIAADYYTLNFVPETVNSIAYATSFGQSSLPKNSAKKAEVFLKKIKHIGVREESGQKLVKEIANRDVPVVCDPTLLFTGDEWMAIQQKEPIIKGKYILCYFLGNNPPHREFAKRLKEVTGCKIIALTHLDEFVKSDVITDRNHGNYYQGVESDPWLRAFSLIFVTDHRAIHVISESSIVLVILRYGIALMLAGSQKNWIMTKGLREFWCIQKREEKSLMQLRTTSLTLKSHQKPL